jgi:hypothetical protein
LLQPTVAKQDDAVAAGAERNFDEIFHLDSGRQRDDGALESQADSRFFQPTLRVGAEPLIVAVDVVIDDVIRSVAKSTVEHRPTQDPRRCGKTQHQGILLVTDDKRPIHGRCYCTGLISRHAATKLLANSGLEPKCKCT